VRTVYSTALIPQSARAPVLSHKGCGRVALVTEAEPPPLQAITQRAKDGLLPSKRNTSCALDAITNLDF